MIALKELAYAFIQFIHFVDAKSGCAYALMKSAITPFFSKRPEILAASTGGEIVEELAAQKAEMKKNGCVPPV